MFVRGLPGRVRAWSLKLAATVTQTPTRSSTCARVEPPFNLKFATSSTIILLLIYCGCRLRSGRQSGLDLPGKSNGWNLQSNLAVPVMMMQTSSQPSTQQSTPSQTHSRIRRAGTGSELEDSNSLAGLELQRLGEISTSLPVAVTVDQQHSDSEPEVPVESVFVHHQLERAERVAALTIRMREAYAPFNQQLFDLLGRWVTVPSRRRRDSTGNTTATSCTSVTFIVGIVMTLT